MKSPVMALVVVLLALIVAYALFTGKMALTVLVGWALLIAIVVVVVLLVMRLVSRAP